MKFWWSLFFAMKFTFLFLKEPVKEIFLKKILWLPPLLEINYWLTHWLTQNLKSKHTSASKNQLLWVWDFDWVRDKLLLFFRLFSTFLNSQRAAFTYSALHFGIRAMAALSSRISELCLPFFPHPNISDGNFNLIHHFFFMQI